MAPPAGGDPVVTYAQLWSADPDAWRAAGAAWRGLLPIVTGRSAEVAQIAGALQAGWSGAAAAAAGGHLNGLRGQLDASRPAFVEIDQVLAEYADQLARARAMLDATVTAAARDRVLVDRHGGVSLDPDRPPAAGDVIALRRTAAGIKAALDAAAGADADAARRLEELTAAAATGLVAQPPPYRPPGCTQPAQVSAWWAGLTPAQRRWLVLHEPGLVGRLDGVPVAARDQANRLLLDQQRADLLARRADLLARSPKPAKVSGQLHRVDGLLAGIDAVSERLESPAGPRAYLLGLDPAGDGRAVVALGDPDHADNVLTYVPGMTSDLPSVAGELGRAHRMAARCAELDPTERTAAVLWLDYDAPDFVDQAARSSYARDAGPALHRFQEGLRATHEGPPAQQTVVGHSYGSLVVGATARDHGLAADSLVFLGSPGVGVDHVRDLGLPAGQVWSSTAHNDVIQYVAPSPRGAYAQLVLSAAVPAWGPLLTFGLPDRELWFGRNPSDPAFGAHVFGGAAHGHTGYWDRGNPALDNLARITLGGAHQAGVR